MESEEKIKARNKEYYREHREKISKQARDYYKNNRKKQLLNNKEWKKKNPENISRRSKLYNANARKELIELLGGKCVRCGFDDPRALQVDHIDGGGCKAVKSIKGNKNYYHLKKVREGSADYQLLCANCNWIKRYENNEVRSYLFNIQERKFLL